MSLGLRNVQGGHLVRIGSGFRQTATATGRLTTHAIIPQTVRRDLNLIPEAPAFNIPSPCRAGTWCASGAASARQRQPRGAWPWRTQTCRRCPSHGASTCAPHKRRSLPAEPPATAASTRLISGVLFMELRPPPTCFTKRDPWDRIAFSFLRGIVQHEKWLCGNSRCEPFVRKYRCQGWWLRASWAGAWTKRESECS